MMVKNIIRVNEQMFVSFLVLSTTSILSATKQRQHSSIEEINEKVYKHLNLQSTGHWYRKSKKRKASFQNSINNIFPITFPSFRGNQIDHKG